LLDAALDGGTSTTQAIINGAEPGSLYLVM